MWHVSQPLRAPALCGCSAGEHPHMWRAKGITLEANPHFWMLLTGTGTDTVASSCQAMPFKCIKRDIPVNLLPLWVSRTSSLPDDP